MEKSYNRKGNLRFKSSNEAEKFGMEGRKAARKLRKKLEDWSLLASYLIIYYCSPAASHTCKKLAYSISDYKLLSFLKDFRIANNSLIIVCSFTDLVRTI